MVSISSAFDLLATGISLQYKFFGEIDKYMLKRIAPHFSEKKFKRQNEPNG